MKTLLFTTWKTNNNEQDRTSMTDDIKKDQRKYSSQDNPDNFNSQYSLSAQYTQRHYNTANKNK